jgi:hypothetical protein
MVSFILIALVSNKAELTKDDDENRVPLPMPPQNFDFDLPALENITNSTREGPRKKVKRSKVVSNF